MIDNIYMPKRPCPRDMGTFFCEDCINKWSRESSNIDYPINLSKGDGCGLLFGEMVCGDTWLGETWCKDCIESGNREPVSHFGMYEIVATIKGDQVC